MRKITAAKKDREPNAITKRVLAQTSGEGVDALKALNPHLHGDHVVADTLLREPELPGARTGESISVGGEAFDGFAKQVLAALDATATRLSTAHGARLVEQKELGALLASAPLKRAFEVDSELRAQAAATEQVFKQDQERPKQAEKTMAALKTMAGTELAALAKLLA